MTKGAFKLEAEMLKPAVRWLEGNGLSAKREFATPWGVCDLVAVRLDPCRVSCRLRNGQRQPIGPTARVALLHRIPDEIENTYVTLGRLSREFDDIYSLVQLQDELDQLTKRKFIRSPRANSFQKINGWIPLHDRIVAIELKLGRVNDAISQAYSHLAFTTESYVALPSEVAVRAVGVRRSKFVAAGVGLMAVERSGCKVLIRPTASEGVVDPVAQMHCVERFWRSRSKGNSS